MNLRVAFFHGLESSPKTDKNEFLEKFDYVYDPPMDYRDNGLFERTLAGVKKNKIDLLIGSSMGGWFAYCIGTLTGIPTLLFNPAVHSRSFDPVVRMGTKRAVNTVVFGRNDTDIVPKESYNYFLKNGIGTFYYNYESNGHRTPIDIFSKWVNYCEKKMVKENTSLPKGMRLNYFSTLPKDDLKPVMEEWAIDAPGVGADYSFLPEEISNTLHHNFLRKMPPAGNLTIEDNHEIGLVKSEMKRATEEDKKFALAANDSPPEIFYQWLILRGEKPSMKELKDLWNHDSNMELINNMKVAWQRLRPYMSHNIIPLTGTTSNTYSFPSGHSCGSHYMACMLANKYPHLANSLTELADKIGNSRILSGVHYPSDVEEGKKIGIALAKKETLAKS